MTQNGKNVLVFGARDILGNQLIDELTRDGHRLLLCGSDLSQQQAIASRHGETVAGVARYDGDADSEAMKDVQVMIETCGSIDAIVYLLPPESGISFLEHSSCRIGDIIGNQMVAPMHFLHALYPYLRKTSGSSVVFLDPDLACASRRSSEVGQSGRYGLWGFCEAIKPEFQDRGINIRCISPANLFLQAEPVAGTFGGRLSSSRCNRLVREVRAMINGDATGYGNLEIVNG